jgi:hypothetical protein
VNVVGCIVGPLIASFLLLPWLGERGALVILTTPLILIGVWALCSTSVSPRLELARE